MPVSRCIKEKRGGERKHLKLSSLAFGWCGMQNFLYMCSGCNTFDCWVGERQLATATKERGRKAEREKKREIYREDDGLGLLGEVHHGASGFFPRWNCARPP